MTLKEKKRKLRKLKSLLNTAIAIENDLTSLEESPFTSNGGMLYKIRYSIKYAREACHYINY